MEKLYRITALKNHSNNVKKDDYFICNLSLPFGMQIKKALIANGKFKGMPIEIKYDFNTDKNLKDVNGWLIEPID